MTAETKPTWFIDASQLHDTIYTAAHVGLGFPCNSFFIWEGLSLHSLRDQKTEAKHDMRNGLEVHHACVLMVCLK